MQKLSPGHTLKRTPSVPKGKIQKKYNHSHRVIDSSTGPTARCIHTDTQTHTATEQKHTSAARVPRKAYSERCVYMYTHQGNLAWPRSTPSSRLAGLGGIGGAAPESAKALALCSSRGTRERERPVLLLLLNHSSHAQRHIIVLSSRSSPLPPSSCVRLVSPAAPPAVASPTIGHFQPTLPLQSGNSLAVNAVILILQLGCDGGRPRRHMDRMCSARAHCTLLRGEHNMHTERASATQPVDFVAEWEGDGGFVE